MTGLQLTALERMFEVAAELHEASRRDLASRGLNTRQAELLIILRTKGPVRQRELSEALRCTPRHVTGLVDELEEKGLVERHAHPTDRRATLVKLTTKGSSSARKLTKDRDNAAASLLGDINHADLESFMMILDRLLSVMRSHDADNA